MGGYNGHNFLNTLQIFDPSTNTWSTPTTTGVPAARASLTSNVVNGKIYVLGGASNNNSVLNTLEVFDPSTNNWSIPAATGTFVARFNAASNVVDGKIYVMGGTDSSDDILNAFQVFDPIASTWSMPTTTGTFTARSNFASSVVDNKIYAMGGWDSIVLNTNEVFTLATNDVKTSASPSGVELFPNPANGILSIYGVPINTLNITVENILGETVLELANPHAPIVTIDVSKLSPGTYFAKFVMPDSILTRKIVRE